MNRFRIRVCDEARQRGERTDLEMTASAALLRASTGLHGVGFVTEPRSSQGLKPAASRREPQLQPTSSSSLAAIPASRVAMLSPTAAHPACPQPKSQTFTGARSSPPRSPSKPVGPLDRGCPSPRPRPFRGPDLHAVRTQSTESAGDDDQLSFSATDYSDDFADPNDSEIYTDFSIIFGSSGGGDGGIGSGKVEADTERGTAEGNNSASEHFEDYMDDLDGIPWDAR